MNKFTDFSDQVTFVSSQIIGRDFSEYYKFVDKSTKTTYWLTENQWNQVKKLSSFEDKLNKVLSFKPPTGNKPPKSDKGDSGKGKNNGQNANPPNSGSWKDLREADEVLKYAESEAGWGKDSPEAEEARRQRSATFENMITSTESKILEGQIANLKLEKEKSKLERQKRIRDDGGIVRHGGIGLINAVANSEAGKNLPKFHRDDWEEDVTDKKFGGGEALPEGVYERNGRYYKKHSKDTITSYLSNNPKFAKAAGKAVTTAAKTAGDAALKMTGFKESEETEKLRKSLKSAKADLKEAKKNGTGLNSWLKSKKVDRIDKKLTDSEKSDKFAHVRKVSDTVGTGVTVAKTAISSKARENVVKQEGVEGLQQKQAKLLYLLGDRSKDTKIAVGDTKGLGLIGKAKSKVFQHKINKNRQRYQESLNAQYQPAPGYVQYRYPQAVGFSEEQVKALNGILSKNFSEGAEVFEGLNLSWQPEEYAKLNSILETDFETLDAQVAESQPDMSEKKVEENVSNEQVEDSQSGEIDVSDTIDYDNLDPETLTALVDKSYYEAPDEEKRYQEMIAKGFAEKESSYNNFLESMSDFVDQSL